MVSTNPLNEEITDLPSSNDIDLGIFEEFYLHSQPSGESNLGEMQPISLEVKKSDISPIEPNINEELGLVKHPVSENLPVSEPDTLSDIAAINLADQLPAGFDNEDMFVIPREPLFEIPSELPGIDTGVTGDQPAEELVSAKLPPLDFFTGSEPVKKLFWNHQYPNSLPSIFSPAPSL